MEKSLISVIVPIYNVSRYLERCMESLLHQTYKNIEIIMVDDGSPDDCVDVYCSGIGIVFTSGCIFLVSG